MVLLLVDGAQNSALNSALVVVQGRSLLMTHDGSCIRVSTMVVLRIDEACGSKPLVHTGTGVRLPVPTSGGRLGQWPGRDQSS